MDLVGVISGIHEFIKYDTLARRLLGHRYRHLAIMQGSRGDLCQQWIAVVRPVDVFFVAHPVVALTMGICFDTDVTLGRQLGKRLFRRLLALLLQSRQLAWSIVLSLAPALV